MTLLSCYSELSAPWVLFWEESGVDNFFFLTLGYTWSNFCVRYHTFKPLLFLSWPADLCCIRIYYIWCLLHLLDTKTSTVWVCSFFDCEWVFYGCGVSSTKHVPGLRHSTSWVFTTWFPSVPGLYFSTLCHYLRPELWPTSQKLCHAQRDIFICVQFD